MATGNPLTTIDATQQELSWHVVPAYAERSARGPLPLVLAD